MFDAELRDDVLCITARQAVWLSSGPAGGVVSGGAAYNITVPDGFSRTDLAAYIRHRRHRAGFSQEGPALLTGVKMAHARAAQLDGVVAYATVGLSNPAGLPQFPAGSDAGRSEGDVGTVNLIVGTENALDDAGLATLFGVVVEAKTATLLGRTGHPGTTTDAVIIGSHQEGPEASFAGSATDVGRAARVCVRDAVQASLAAAYPEGDWPESVPAAEYGVLAERKASVFQPS